MWNSSIWGWTNYCWNMWEANDVYHRIQYFLVWISVAGIVVSGSGWLFPWCVKVSPALLDRWDHDYCVWNKVGLKRSKTKVGGDYCKINLIPILSWNGAFRCQLFWSVPRYVDTKKWRFDDRPTSWTGINGNYCPTLSGPRLPLRTSDLRCGTSGIILQFPGFIVLRPEWRRCSILAKKIIILEKFIR